MMYKLPNLMSYKFIHSYSLIKSVSNIKKNFKHKLENKLQSILIPYSNYLNVIKGVNIHSQLLLEF